MKPYLLGIDIGTSACKVAVFEKSGTVVAAANGDYPVYYPKEGWAEQNPEEWWEAVCDAIPRVLVKGNISPEEIKGIGIDGQSWSAIAVDKDGNVLTNTPIWMDTRATDICEEFNEKIGKDKIFELCGISLQPSYTTAKIIWYQRNLPEVYAKTYKILQSNSYIAYKLTGVMSQDVSQGYGLHCFDMRKAAWDEEMCKKLGIPMGFLPEICDCDHVVGTVTEKAAEESGLAVGTPVVAGGLDAACGTLGAGVIHPGETQEQHEELMDFVDQMEFDRLGVFTYSPEEDTPAAVMPDQIAEEVKEERQADLMELQQEIAFDNAENMIGREMLVMIEGKVADENAYVGRTYRDAPNVDGLIFINTEEELISGDFAKVKITGALEYDLIGELL